MISLDLTDTAAVLARARYISVMFGRFGSRWHCDGYLLRSLEEQTACAEDSGRSGISDYTRGILTEEIPVEHVARCIASPTPPGGHCDGYGNIHLGHDSDYDCGGCFGCRPQRAAIGWSIGAWFWSIVTGAERARLECGVRGMQVLASIGRAVASAGAPGLGVGRWLADTIAEWNLVRSGRWYRVVGRRGKAKEHFGVEGEVVRIEEAPGYQGGRGTRRAALKIPGETKWIWVPVSTLAPAREPAEVTREKRREEESKAERAKRPAFAGAKGDAAWVIDGPNAGRNGTVIWTGFARGEQRVGVKWGAGENDVAWCSAVDVIAADQLIQVTAIALHPQISESEATLMTSADPGMHQVFADRLEERGHAGLAAAWRGPVPVAAPKPEPRRRSGHPRRAMTYQRGRVGY